MEHLDKIKKLNDQYKQSLLKKAKDAKPPTNLIVKFDDIKDSLSGYGRIISYKSNNSSTDPQFNEIDSVVEG